jgi:hypothetical protein
MRADRGKWNAGKGDKTMSQRMPEDRILRQGDDPRLIELLKSDAAYKLEAVTAVRTLMWRKKRQS